MKGRHCAICHKPGGVAATAILSAWGFTNHYAHPPCIKKERQRRLRFEAQKPTAIEIVAHALEENEPGAVGDILVPEQCCELWIEGKHYQVIVMEVSGMSNRVTITVSRKELGMIIQAVEEQHDAQVDEVRDAKPRQRKKAERELAEWGELFLDLNKEQPSNEQATKQERR